MFLATEDWFVRSHFLPLLKRAVEEGYDVSAACRLSGSLADIEGVRLIDTPFARKSLMPWEVGRQLSHLNAIIAQEQPHIIHAIASKPIGLLLMSAANNARVFALTGRGYLGAKKSLVAGIAAERFRSMLRARLDDAKTMLLVENEADRGWVENGRALPDERVVLMPGAGVDPNVFVPTPEPPAPPLIVGVAARLVRSKGIDLAVDAVRTLRERGVNIELRIAGAVDPDNPDHVSESELTRWRSTPCVSLIGRVSDVNAFWAGAHIACLPSRGGEGLPRLLLEAAACGRPIVTTDVPGCADFVLHRQTGLVVPANNAGLLADAIAELAAEEQLRQRMGEAGRARVLAGYTERHAADAAASAWRALLEPC
jgi:glycosyltransferase involved in cell wall biosynthesis